MVLPVPRPGSYDSYSTIIYFLFSKEEFILYSPKPARIYPGRGGQNQKHKEMKSWKWYHHKEKCAIFRGVYNFFRSLKCQFQ